MDFGDHEDTPVTPASSSTTHSFTVDGEELTYTATAGYLEVAEEPFGADQGQDHPPARARVFLTSYVKANRDGIAGEQDRPVIIGYNGGPGAPSMWLHLGLLGPKRVIATTGEQNTSPATAPYSLVPNEHTPLWDADVVIIDLVNSGYSRVAPGQPIDAFHGVRRDINLIAETIRLWVTQNERWNSPLYLLGESYGVLRTIKVSEALVSSYGLYPQGLILISSPIGPDSMDFSPGSILAYSAFLPAYAAVAHYHGHRAEEPLEHLLQEAEAYAGGEYLRVLTRGNRLSGDERQHAIESLHRITGLSRNYLSATDLRVTNDEFMAEVLRPKGQIVGRNDGRFVGWNASGIEPVPHSDPSYDLIRGPFASAFNDYVRRELGFNSDLPYEVTTRRARPWPTSKRPGDDFTAVAELSSIIRKHPNLSISYHLGYYDLCTPYWGALTDLAQVEAPRELIDRIDVHQYPSGHMIYLEEESLRLLGRRIRKFVAAAALPQ